MRLVVADGKNPRYENAGHTVIFVEVKFNDEKGNPLYGGEFLPFSASQDDIEEHGRAIFNACIQGAFGEVAEYVEPEIPLSDQKEQKLADLSRWFAKASDSAHITSSLGFEIDADETANRNIEGLIVAVEAGQVSAPVYFMDYNNIVHPVTLADLKTLRLEVIANGQALYQQKWLLREAINRAETKEELDLVVIPTINSEEAE